MTDVRQKKKVKSVRLLPAGGSLEHHHNRVHENEEEMISSKLTDSKRNTNEELHRLMRVYDLV